MGAQPETNGITAIANIELANTVDFHLASSNWIPVVQRYVNEVATYLIYSYTKHTADPISSQANFFFDFNSNALDLRSDIRGSIDSGTVDTLFKQHSFDGPTIFKSFKQIKLDTLLQPDEVWIRTDDGTPEVRQQNQYHAYNFVQKADKWYTFDEDVDSLIKETLDKLKDEYGHQFMPLEFQMYWYEKFKKSHDLIQKEYKEIISQGFDPSDDFFADISDSIGCLARSVETINPLYTNILTDRNMKQVIAANSIVSTLAPQTFDKLDKETQKFDVEMCMQTNTLFRSNIKNIVESFAASNVPHQASLVTDTAHIRRMKDLQANLNGEIAQTIGIGYSLLFYHNNKLNTQHIPSSPDINMVVEDSNIRVDMLKNTIKNINKEFGNRSLNARSLAAADQS